MPIAARVETDETGVPAHFPTGLPRGTPGQTGQTAVKPPRRARTPQLASNTVASHAMHWLLPWTRANFPGLQRGLLSTLAQSLTWTAVRDWRAGRRPLPSWAARAWADRIEARSRRGLEIVAALRAHAAEMDGRVKRTYGFCATTPRPALPPSDD